LKTFAAASFVAVGGGFCARGAPRSLDAPVRE
jgi:hypothetical protein